MDFWMIGFWFMYALFVFTLYKAYLSKLINKLRFSGRYLHYHIIDTGENGDIVFQDGENEINGKKRIYASEKIKHGTLFYEEKNAEPLEVMQDLSKYKYYCNTKNYDTVARNDILQTLLILNAKDLIILLIKLDLIK